MWLCKFEFIGMNFVGVGVSTTRCGLIAHFKTGCRGRQPLQKEFDKPQFVDLIINKKIAPRDEKDIKKEVTPKVDVSLHAFHGPGDYFCSLLISNII